MVIVIRNAIKTDLDKVGDFCVGMLLYHEKFDSEYKPSKTAKEKYISHLSESLSDKKKILLVAELDNNLIGFAFAKIDKKPPVLDVVNYGVISDVYVDEKCRGKGVSQLLVSKLFDWFKTNGISDIEISVHTQNSLANIVWEKYGFKPYMTKFRLKL
ncbi:GNAT family N-acetyltransferase [Candidatus Woesearchaeota archaeon]|jgi:ribosomal protein S18 acetylase RimI-like enzyme|nr:GNAT family N-acetyltransferase [Candidatus Woesearchaeota archaeon]